MQLPCSKFFVPHFCCSYSHKTVLTMYSAAPSVGRQSRLLANARPRNVQPEIVGVIWMRMRTQLDPANVPLAIAMSATVAR